MTEPLDVSQYETLADVYTGVGEHGSDHSTRQSIIGASYSMLELCAEIRRLQGIVDEVGKVADEAMTDSWHETASKPESSEAKLYVGNRLRLALGYKTEED